MSEGNEPLDDWFDFGDLPADLAEAAADRAARRRAETVEHVAALRASITGLSPVLVAACADEALPITAVVYGLVPLVNWPQQDYGWPWRSFTQWSALALLKFGYSFVVDDAGRYRNDFIRRNLRDSVFIRAPERPEGAWAASVRDGVVGIEIRKGTTVVRSRGKRGTLRLEVELPQSVAVAACGRRVAELVNSPLFADPALVITSVSVAAGSTLVRFRCPAVRTDLASLTSAPCSVQLGRDPALTGNAALLDLLAREIEYSSNDDAGHLASRLRTRVLSLEVTRPPGVARLRVPPVEWVARATLRLFKSGRVSECVPF